MENTDFQFPEERRIRVYDISKNFFIQKSTLEDGSTVTVNSSIEPQSDEQKEFAQLAVITSRDLPPSDWLPELYHFLKLLTLLTDET